MCSEKTEENIVDCLSSIGKILIYPGVFQSILGLFLIISGFLWEIPLLYILGFCEIGLTFLLIFLLNWSDKVNKRREKREQTNQTIIIE